MPPPPLLANKRMSCLHESHEVTNATQVPEGGDHAAPPPTPPCPRRRTSQQHAATLLKKLVRKGRNRID